MVRKNPSPRVHNNAVTPGDILGLGVAGRRAHGHVALGLQGTRPGQQGPVRRTGDHVEGAGVDQQLAGVARVQLGQFAEAHVVADAQADFEGALKHATVVLDFWRTSAAVSMNFEGYKPYMRGRKISRGGWTPEKLKSGI